MAIRRVCICCGEKYEFCPTCGKEKQPSWKMIYDTEECMKIGQIMIASRGDNPSVSKAQAKKEMEKYPDTLQKIIKNNSNTANKIKEVLDIKEAENNSVEDVFQPESFVDKDIHDEKMPDEVSDVKVEQKKEEKFHKTNYHKSDKNK